MQIIVFDIPTADELANMADRGEDISQFFTNTGKMKYPARPIQIEFPGDMQHETAPLLKLDKLDNELK